MKIYAICLVKNEEDVIGQTLGHAIGFCEQIFVIDNGSTDGTQDVVQTLAERHRQVAPFGIRPGGFDNRLRWLAYDTYHHRLSDEDWWLILDGDEFLAEDPLPVIEQARTEAADIIHAWQIQFYYTEKDYEAWKAGEDSRDKPIFERRRYYRIDWKEPRLFRNRVPGTWSDSVLQQRSKVCQRRILNRHYQYRDPVQIEMRLRLRYGHPAFASQVRSPDWRSVMRPSASLQYHTDDEAWRFSLSGVAHSYLGWARYITTSRLQRARNRLAGLLR